MPVQGIIKEILVEEGQQVKKDQILIRLDTDLTKARNEALSKTFELNKTIEKRSRYFFFYIRLIDPLYMP